MSWAMSYLNPDPVRSLLLTGQGDVSVKLFTMQVYGPELESLELTQNLRALVYTCNPGIGGGRERTPEPSQPT